MHIILRKGEALEENKKVIVNETHLEFKQFQVAYNNWGHITIRGFNSQIVPFKEETKGKLDDILIILSVAEVQELLKFIKKNKEVVYEETENLSDNTKSLTIEARPSYGIIDEVRIYNRALSEEEIQDLYNYFGHNTEDYPD